MHSLRTLLLGAALVAIWTVSDLVCQEPLPPDSLITKAQLLKLPRENPGGVNGVRGPRSGPLSPQTGLAAHTNLSRFQGPEISGKRSVVVTLVATHPSGDSAVAEIRYVLDGAEAGAAVVKGHYASLLLIAPGTTVLSYYSVTRAGAREPPQTFSVFIP